MPIDRKLLLQRRENALAASNQEQLPPEIRALYKQAADQTDVVLGLQDAKTRRTAAQPLTPPSGGPADSATPAPMTPQLSPQLSSALKGS